MCQVEAALTFDHACSQPCAECDLRITPVTVEGSTVAVDVTRIRPPMYAIEFPFAPGAIEFHRPKPTRRQRFVASGGGLFLAAVLVGLLAGFARGKGWL